MDGGHEPDGDGDLVAARDLDRLRDGIEAGLAHRKGVLAEVDDEGVRERRRAGRFAIDLHRRPPPRSPRAGPFPPGAGSRRAPRRSRPSGRAGVWAGLALVAHEQVLHSRVRPQIALADRHVEEQPWVASRGRTPGGTSSARRRDPGCCAGSRRPRRHPSPGPRAIRTAAWPRRPGGIRRRGGGRRGRRERREHARGTRGEGRERLMGRSSHGLQAPQGIVRARAEARVRAEARARPRRGGCGRLHALRPRLCGQGARRRGERDRRSAQHRRQSFRAAVQEPAGRASVASEIPARGRTGARRDETSLTRPRSPRGAPRSRRSREHPSDQADDHPAPYHATALRPGAVGPRGQRRGGRPLADESGWSRRRTRSRPPGSPASGSRRAPTAEGRGGPPDAATDGIRRAQDVQDPLERPVAPGRAEGPQRKSQVRRRSRGASPDPSRGSAAPPPAVQAERRPARSSMGCGGFLQDCSHESGDPFVWKRSVGGQQLVKHDAERPDVRSRIGRARRHELLGRHVERRAEDARLARHVLLAWTSRTWRARSRAP